MGYVWLGLMVLFLVLEGVSVALVSLWFAVGALAAVVTALLGGELWLQITVFVVVSGGMLALLRPALRKYFNPRLTKTNVDSVIGATGLVTEDVENLTAQGRVKIGGIYWAARSTSGEMLPADTQVKVDRVEGVKVFVSPVKESVIGR